MREVLWSAVARYRSSQASLLAEHGLEARATWHGHPGHALNGRTPEASLLAGP
jgi:hypothetical protein